ncbi:MAG: YigZ family protein [Chitinophagaceae bacterium]
MPDPKKYRTIDAPTNAEFRDRGSRFLAFVFPIKSVEAAKLLIKELKAQHPKANHHCVAYRLGYDGNTFRASDDGEPAGSAGRPMLAAIDSADLTDLMVAVVRYFGGTLLGIPGLINAYGTAVKMALESAIVSEHWVTGKIKIDCGYDALGAVLHLLKAQEAQVLHQDLQLFCSIQASVPLHLLDECVARLSDIRGVQAEVVS